MSSLILLIVAWFFSPIVLLLIWIGNRAKIRQLEQQQQHQMARINSLLNHIRTLYETGEITKEQYEQTVHDGETAPHNVADPAPKPAWQAAMQTPASVTAQPMPEDHSATAPALEVQLPAVEKKPVNVVNIILNLGVLLVLVSGTIFATTSWNLLSNLAKTAIVCFLPLFFMGISLLAEKKLKLKQTGIAFYTLGCLFVLVSFLAISAFRLFGDWFSLFGEGTYCVTLIASVLFGIVTAYGAKKYRLFVFVWASGLACTLAVYGLIRWITPSADLLWLGMSVYCVACLLVSHRVIENLIETHPFSDPDKLLLRHISLFAQVNLFAVGFLTAVLGGSGMTAGLSALIFAGGLLGFTQMQEGKSLFVFPFILLFLTGFGKAGYAYGASETFLSLSLSSAILLLLGELKVFSPAVQKLLRVTSGIGGILVFLSSNLFYFTAPVKSPYEVLASLILLGAITWSAIQQKQRWLTYIHPVLSTVFLFEAIQMIDDRFWIISQETKVAIWIGLSALLFGIYRFAKPIKGVKLRTYVSDLWFTLALVLVFVYAYRLDFSLHMLCALVALCAVVIGVAYSLQPSLYNKLFAWSIPVIVLATEIPIVSLTKELLPTIYAHQIFLYFYIGFFALFAWGLVCYKSHKLLDMISRSSCVVVPLAGLFGCISAVDLRGYFSVWHAWLITVWFVLQYIVNQKVSEQEQVQDGYRSIFAYLAGAGILFSPAIRLWANWQEMREMHFLLAVSAMGVLVMLFAKFAHNRKFSGFPSNQFLTLCCVVLNSMALGACWSYLADPDLWKNYAIPVLILCCTGLWANHWKKAYLFNLIPLLPVYLVVTVAASQWANGLPAYIEYIECYAAVCVFVVMGIAGRLFHPDKLITATDKKIIKIDYYTILNVFAPIIMVLSDDKHWTFAGMLFAMLYAFSFWRRTTQMGDMIALTVAGAFGGFAWWIQPFFSLPAIVETEWNLVPILLFAVAVRRIWKPYEQLGFAATTLAAFVAVGIQWGDILSGMNVVDALILGVAMTVLILISFVLKSKRWFLLSAINILLLAIYLSRDFWFSIKWWVYLLVSGMVLIAFAAINEFYRKHDQKPIFKSMAFWDNWNW